MSKATKLEQDFSIEGSFALHDKACRDFFRGFHERVETTIAEAFPTPDALVDAILAGGYLLFYPVEITSEKMSRGYRLAYPDKDYQGESQ